MQIKEIAASLYPWDLADEGVERCVDTLVEEANVNSVYLVGVMHKEKRPLTGMFYPHNPQRKFYLPEDSRIYYRLDERSFENTPLKPLYSEREFLKGTDWLDTLTRYARGKGLKTGVEISHTFFDMQTARTQFPETLQRDVKGEPIYKALCPNNEAVREYVRALFADSVKNHDIDFIQTCMLLFHQGTELRAPWFMSPALASPVRELLGVLNGGCFCESCRRRAQRMGYDWERIVRDLSQLHDVVNAQLGRQIEGVMEQHLLLGANLLESAFLLQNPSLYQWLEFRVRSIASLFQEVYEAVKAVRPEVEVRYNTYFTHPELAGLDFRAVAPWIDSLRNSDYSEQTQAADGFARKMGTLFTNRYGIGFEKDLIAAVGIRPNATPEVIIKSIRLLAGMGIDGLSLGHYDGADLSLLRAVKQGMREANLTVAPSCPEGAVQ